MLCHVSQLLNLISWESGYLYAQMEEKAGWTVSMNPEHKGPSETPSLGSLTLYNLCPPRVAQNCFFEIRPLTQNHSLWSLLYLLCKSEPPVPSVQDLQLTSTPAIPVF